MVDPLAPVPSPDPGEDARLLPSQRLRVASGEAHERTECAVDWKVAFSTIPRYLSVLTAFYPVMLRIDALVAGPLAGKKLRDQENRRSATWIEQDIALLGGNLSKGLSEHVSGFLLPPVATTSPSEAIGELYVLEGSSLGSQILARLLKASLGIDSQTGGKYFTAYGAETMPRWQRFRGWLDERLVETPDLEEALDGSRRMFAFVEFQLKARHG